MANRSKSKGSIWESPSGPKLAPAATPESQAAVKEAEAKVAASQGDQKRGGSGAGHMDGVLTERGRGPKRGF